MACFLLFLKPATATDDAGTVISSQEGLSVSMDVNVGFDGIYRAEIPFPVTVNIHNGSDVTLEGKLSILTNNWVPPANYIHDVNIPPHSRESFEMIIHEGNATVLTVRLLNNKNMVVQEKIADIFPRNIVRSNVILLISENPDDFQYLTQISAPGLRKFQTYDLYNYSSLRGEYNLSGITIVKNLPAHLDSTLMSWDSLNAVFCDIRSYLDMNSKLKNYLQAWVRNGGELMLFSPDEKLSQSEINLLNNDEFISFQIIDYTPLKLPETKDAEIFRTPESSEILIADYPVNHSLYHLDGFSYPLISQTTSGTGGLTFLHFQPSFINNDRLRSWIEVFFQLSLLTSEPHQQIVHDRFTRTISGMATQDASVPTASEKYIKGISGIAYNFLLQFIIPVCLILIFFALLYKMNRIRLFMTCLLPVIIAAMVFIPQISDRHNMVPGRPLEVYNYLQMGHKHFPAALYQVIIAGKAFPEAGTINIRIPGEFSFFDEMVNTSRGARPMIHVNNSPPGSFESLEKTREKIRSITVKSQLNHYGSITGEVNILPDGKIRYDIHNNTQYKISNPKYFSIDQSLAGYGGRKLPDIEPGKSIRGFINSGRDDLTDINSSLLEFCEKFNSDLFSPETRREILYYIESIATGLAYKNSKHPSLHDDTAYIFGWTSDLVKKIEIDRAVNTDKQITFITARLKVIRLDYTPVINKYEIGSILQDDIEDEESDNIDFMN